MRDWAQAMADPVVQAFFDAWHKRDAEALRATLDDGARFLVNGREAKPDAVLAWAAAEWAAFPDGQFVCDTVGGAGRWVIQWTWTGTHEGEYNGIPGTARKLERKGFTVLHVNKLKVLGGTWKWDVHSFVTQVLGPMV